MFAIWDIRYWEVSLYLVDIIHPTLNKNKHRVINSSSFVNEDAKSGTTLEEIQVFYDVIDLCPFIPIDQAITVLIDTLIDVDDLNIRTKLTLTDIHKLTEFCLSKSYFLYDNKIRLLENANPLVYHLW